MLQQLRQVRLNDQVGACDKEMRVNRYEKPENREP